MEATYNRNGGLTLVAMPGFSGMATRIKDTFQKRYPEILVDIAIPEFGVRASGEPFVRLPKEHVGGHDCVILTSGPGTYTMLGQTYFVLCYLVGRRAERISLVTGCFPLTRSDKDEGEEELALVGMVVHLFESGAHGCLDRIIAVDLHAEQEVIAGSKPGLITQISLARQLLTQVIEDVLPASDGKVCLLFPDEGSAKRFKGAVQETSHDLGIKIPIVRGRKERQTSRDSKLLELFGDVDALNGATVVSFDDEAATLGTNMNTAAAMRQDYPIKRFFAVVVHGVLCGEAPILLARPNCPIDGVFITDTIPPDHRPELEGILASKRLRVVSWLEHIATIIYRHHLDKNIRNLQ